MAREWLEDLYEDRTPNNQSLEEWLQSDKCSLGIEGLTPDNCDEHYTALYDKRFGGNEREAGDYMYKDLCEITLG